MANGNFIGGIMDMTIGAIDMGIGKAQMNRGAR
jgi:hypothetical protein